MNAIKSSFDPSRQIFSNSGTAILPEAFNILDSLPKGPPVDGDGAGVPAVALFRDPVKRVRALPNISGNLLKNFEFY
jgi:hypothetical protein